MTIGQRIKDLRIANGISQIELAKHLTISNSTLSQYESGQRTPSDDIKIKIASFFNVSVDYLLGNDTVTASPSLDEQLEGIDFALYGEVKDLTDDEKQDILDFIRFKKSQRK